MINDYKIDILAKPSGITLKQHTDDVVSEGALILKKLIATQEKYLRFIGKKLDRRLELACLHHDDGKEISKIWQKNCQEDYLNFKQWQESNGKKSFADYCQSVKSKAGKYIREKSQGRHEIYSLIGLIDNDPPLWMIAAIAAHHSKLGKAHEQRWKEVKKGKEFWEKLKRYSNKFESCRYTPEQLHAVALKQYEVAGPRSLLRLADHRASAKEDGELIPDPGYFSYTFPASWKKRPIQQLVEEHWQDDLLLVRAPTGAGKTDASLLWASLQIQHHKADRLIIAMPTRFTSNALAVNVSETLSDTGLYHSSAWQLISDLSKNPDATKLAMARFYHEQAYLLQTSTTICTIDHLLTALTLSREEHQSMTFSLANACLVIDEIDFYDQFTQFNIFILLSILKCWEVPILIMSASLPDTVKEDYNALGYGIKNILEDTSDYERPRFRICDLKDSEGPEDMEELLRLCLKEKSAIIYANTVDRAQTYYQWFLDNKRKEDVVLYHSRFTELDKKNKENLLLKRLGHGAWREGWAHGIAILTQIGEMSVNISADLMISDLCPIDRLTQRCGRLCRFSTDKVGSLYIICPLRNGKLFAAPYYKNIEGKKKLRPNEAFLKTKELLSIGQTYSAQRLVTLINQVYSKKQVSTKAENNAEELKKSFMDNWLINPEARSQEDDSGTGFWQARDIMPQMSIYIAVPPLFFPNRSEFRRWESDHCVSIPVYVYRKYEKMNPHLLHLTEVLIGREKLKLVWVDKEVYDETRGL